MLTGFVISIGGERVSVGYVIRYRENHLPQLLWISYKKDQSVKINTSYQNVPIDEEKECHSIFVIDGSQSLRS